MASASCGRSVLNSWTKSSKRACCLAPRIPHGSHCGPAVRGSRLDADHPENGVLIPSRTEPGATVGFNAIPDQPVDGSVIAHSPPEQAGLEPSVLLPKGLLVARRPYGHRADRTVR
jgi:hypothetical protein